MARFNYVATTAYRLRAKYKDCSPIEIAPAEGIRLEKYDLGMLKGMYARINDVPFIAISSLLDAKYAEIVCAHELGHHFLHGDGINGTFGEHSLWLRDSRPEYEANLFAAELLIGDNEFLSCLEPGITCGELAAILGTDENLVAFKAEVLRSKGHILNGLDIKTGFLNSKNKKQGIRALNDLHDF